MTHHRITSSGIFRLSSKDAERSQLKRQATDNGNDIDVKRQRFEEDVSEETIAQILTVINDPKKMLGPEVHNYGQKVLVIMSYSNCFRFRACFRSMLLVTKPQNKRSAAVWYHSTSSATLLLRRCRNKQCLGLLDFRTSSRINCQECQKSTLLDWFSTGNIKLKRIKCFLLDDSFFQQTPHPGVDKRRTTDRWNLLSNVS